MSREVLTALALVLVIEGIAPFASPGGLKRAMLQLVQLDDRVLRVIGLATMLSGLILLYLARRA